ncbi:Phage protein [Macrococcoides canis]|uniref:Uncharacterized protein n=1 Tax=Macrococcoides canis TaxID=1855823 RepID=A0A1W7ABT7_9STAP|nr:MULTISPECIES: hypothetical protein [Macrococcus]ARQ07068.1 hypothetical protein MCCS_14270 [Macrococcus canis]
MDYEELWEELKSCLEETTRNFSGTKAEEADKMLEFMFELEMERIGDEYESEIQKNVERIERANKQCI